MEKTETKNKMVMDELFEALDKTETHSDEARFVVNVIDVARMVARKYETIELLGPVDFSSVFHQKLDEIKEYAKTWTSA